MAKTLRRNRKKKDVKVGNKKQQKKQWRFTIDYSGYFLGFKLLKNNRNQLWTWDSLENVE